MANHAKPVILALAMISGITDEQPMADGGEDTGNGGAAPGNSREDDLRPSVHGYLLGFFYRDRQKEISASGPR